VKDKGPSDCSNSDKHALFKAFGRVEHARQLLASCAVVVKLARNAGLTRTLLKWWYSQCSDRVTVCVWGGGGEACP